MGTGPPAQSIEPTSSFRQNASIDNPLISKRLPQRSENPLRQKPVPITFF